MNITLRCPHCRRVISKLTVSSDVVDNEELTRQLLATELPQMVADQICPHCQKQIGDVMDLFK